MEINKLHTFLLSFKLNGKVQVHNIEAINLRHAKEKILFSYEDATDIRDWTLEKKKDLQKYILKNNAAAQAEDYEKEVELKPSYIRTPDKDQGQQKINE